MFGFGCQTASLAALYGDPFLSNLDVIDVRAIKQSRGMELLRVAELLWIACLSIAAKVEKGARRRLSHVDQVVACYTIMLQSKASLDCSSNNSDRETKRRRLAFDGSSSSGHRGALS
ncbi:hypothetical protein Sjap_010160 [Stephania japonica]|uniref:Uncharacterized protein n=1 Tax=Stephania japonica TaxID=461633 RepID=A0AAP0J930_9MAGN